MRYSSCDEEEEEESQKAEEQKDKKGNVSYIYRICSLIVSFVAEKISR